MVSLVVITALSLSAAPRVFVAPITGANADEATTDLVEDRILVAVKAAARGMEVVGATDVQSILDAEAARQALGCDTMSCANEIADALNAEQLITGQLGRIGDTWQLTLTRTERTTLKVLARSQRESQGKTPEHLLPQIEGQARDLFAPPELHDYVVTGFIVGGVGVAALAAGGVLWALSWNAYFEAERSLNSDPPDIAKAQAARDGGQQLYDTTVIVAAAGAIFTVGGTMLIVLGSLPGPGDE